MDDRVIVYRPPNRDRVDASLYLEPIRITGRGLGGGRSPPPNPPHFGYSDRHLGMFSSRAFADRYSSVFSAAIRSLAEASSALSSSTRCAWACCTSPPCSLARFSSISPAPLPTHVSTPPARLMRVSAWGLPAPAKRPCAAS